MDRIYPRTLEEKCVVDSSAGYIVFGIASSV